MVTFVLIPGLLSDGRVWRPLAEHLRELGNVFDADITDIVSIPDAAATLLSQVDGEVIPIGHSLGGRIAFEIARQGEGRVSALIAADTGHDGLRKGESELREARIELANRDLESLVDEWLPPMLAPDHRDVPLFDDLRDMALHVGAAAHERQIRALMGRPAATDYLPTIDCPSLLLTGSEDSWSPQEDHEAMARLMPNAAVHVIEGSGHFLPVEDPEAVVDIVIPWVSNLEPESTHP